MSVSSSWEFTKIVATIGPASDTVPLLEQLLQAGMNVARLNTKHGTTEWHAERIDRIREASKNTKKPVGVLLDLQGPEIRINLPDKKAFVVEEGEKVAFRSKFIPNDPKQVQVPANVIEALKVGNQISLEDGFCEFTITDHKGDYVLAQAESPFTVSDRKTMNIPGITIDMPALTADDLDKLDAAIKHPVDFIGLSFVRNAKDIEWLRKEMAKRKIEAQVIAKIETQAAIDNLDEIIEAAEGVMVARGDLAVETPMEQFPFWQKEIIRRCRVHGKPVITATQMLKSMVDHPRPTRAEVSDVANAVFDGTDAVMLSEESTIGKYPVRTVKIMRTIINYNNRHAQMKEFEKGMKSQTTAVTKMAMSLINDHLEDIDQVVVLTETGHTAQQLVRHRPSVPVLAVTDRERTVNLLALSYGIFPLYMEFPEGKIEKVSTIIENLKKSSQVKSGEKILVIHGNVFKQPGMTNTVSLIKVE